MFCGECGAKLKKNAAFCGECGAKVPEENTPKDEPKIEQHQTKPMSKKAKIGLLFVAILVVIAVVGYNFLKKDFGPEGVATDYLEALKSNDVDRIYNSLKLDGDTTFITKEVFKEVYNEDANQLKDVTNYKLSEVTYGDDELSAVVKFTVTKSGSEESIYINVVKQDKKKFLIFDEWDLASNNMSVLGVDLIEDYQINVPKDSKVTVSNIELSDNYLDSEKSSSETDVYVIPKLFASTIAIKTVLPNGIEIDDTQSVTKYNTSYTAELSLKALSDDIVTKLQEQVTTDLETLYANIIAKKSWSDVKESYSYNNVNLSDLQDEYVDLYDEIVDDEYQTLKSFDVTNVTVTNVKLNDENQLVISVKFNYNYTLDYKNYNDEVQTKEGKSSYNTSITYDYFENNYKINDISDTVTYFSTW